jgi:hypothetical protein
VDKGRGRTCSIAYAALSNLRALKSSSARRVLDRPFDLWRPSGETKLDGKFWIVVSKWPWNIRRSAVNDALAVKKMPVAECMEPVRG